jgi:hypothetical protein
MEPRWSRFHIACLNCQTQRRRHHCKGFCRRCYTMIKRVWEAKSWDRSQPATLEKMPKLPSFTRKAFIAGLDRRDWTMEEFERYRLELIRQYRVYLDLLRAQEEKRRGSATGWDVEFYLRAVHARIHPKARRGRFYGIARTLHNQFTGEQLSVIYGLMLDMIDHIPWRGIDREILWRAVCDDTDAVMQGRNNAMTSSSGRAPV